MATITEVQTRLALYQAAEAEILQAQEMRHGDKMHRAAELMTVLEQIDKLERRLARMQARADGQRLRHSVANLNRTCPSD